MLFCFCQDLLTRNQNAEVDHFEIVACKHRSDDVLADIVNVPFHGRKQHFASTGVRTGNTCGLLFCLHKWS